MREPKSIPVSLMKEDLERIPQFVSLITELSNIAITKDDHDNGAGTRRAANMSISSGEYGSLLDYGAVTVALTGMELAYYLTTYSLAIQKTPLKDSSERKDFENFLSGLKKFKAEERDDALKVYSSLLFTRDTFTIFFNLLPTLARIEKLLTLQAIFLAESAHCSGDSHPVASALRKLHTEGLVPWKGNGDQFDDGPAVEIFQQLKQFLTAGHPVPPDFSSFAQSYPSWDAFWQIAAWKATRMEKAIEATLRELLIEAWKCPEKAVSPTMPEPDEAIEPEWDWMTETTKPGVLRGEIRPFSYGAGHSVAESLWNSVWDAEHERRSSTDEIPLTFPKDLHTFRCPIPLAAKAVRKVVRHPWRYAAEKDLPDFTGLWGGFSREAERLFSGKESVARTAEGKDITWKDLQDGAESVYKRGIGMLDHLTSVQEYYRPLRAIDPAEWRDTAEVLKEESMAKMGKRA
ncbi:MAG: hypothetical protein ACYCYP_03345 [Leptospirales bacterium]